MKPRESSPDEEMDTLRRFGHAEIVFQGDRSSGEFWLVRFPGQEAFVRGETLADAVRSAAAKMAELFPTEPS